MRLGPLPSFVLFLCGVVVFAMTMFVFFAWVIWIWLLFTVFVDLFGRHDVSGWAKGGWTVFVLVLPYIGVLDGASWTSSKAMIMRSEASFRPVALEAVLVAAASRPPYNEAPQCCACSAGRFEAELR